ncbi:hypothetical protein BDV97DRAFT_352635 [Delphinella strobiligena]|nr:hypothetical protein BDV97DRAFT_352635 [Delphinella strobiligena]
MRVRLIFRLRHASKPSDLSRRLYFTESAAHFSHTAGLNTAPITYKPVDRPLVRNCLGRLNTATIYKPVSPLVRPCPGTMSTQVIKPPPPPLQHPHAVEMENLQRYLGLDPQLLVKNKPNPAAFNDVVLLAIDCEAFELAQKKITEIGVSVLDTRDLTGIEPDADAAKWLAQIKTRHFRIKEYQKLVNKRYIKGCPDKFNFGHSEFINLNQIRNVLTDIFNNPAGVDAPTFDKRKIVLVGHDVKSDIDYLKNIKFSPYKSGRIVGIMDTLTLSGSSKSTTVGLERLLRGLGADPVNLHNAGNDAAYTLQAIVMIAIQQTAQPGAYLKAIQDVVMPETFKQKVRRELKAKKQAQQAAQSALDQVTGLESNQKALLQPNAQLNAVQDVVKTEALEQGALGGAAGEKASDQAVPGTVPFQPVPMQRDVGGNGHFPNEGISKPRARNRAMKEESPSTFDQAAAGPESEQSVSRQHDAVHESAALHERPR